MSFILETLLYSHFQLLSASYQFRLCGRCLLNRVSEDPILNAVMVAQVLRKDMQSRQDFCDSWATDSEIDKLYLFGPVQCRLSSFIHRKKVMLSHLIVHQLLSLISTGKPLDVGRCIEIARDDDLIQVRSAPY